MTGQLPPGWYTNEAGARRFWTGDEWLAPDAGDDDASRVFSSPGDADAPTARRRRTLPIAMGLAALTLFIGLGAWWFVSLRDRGVDNLSEGTPSTATPRESSTPDPATGSPEATAPPEPEVDDSAALQNLALAPGALFGLIEGPSDESCSYVALIAGILPSATPAENYRGRYEQVARDMSLSAELCGTSEGQSTAIRVRQTAEEILDEVNYLGIEWGEAPDPVPAL